MTQPRTPHFPGIKHHAPDGRPLVPVGDFAATYGTGLHAFDYVGFRPPRKGEHYLSGASVAAYRAPNDLPTPYHVVTIGAKYVAARTFVKR